MVRAITDTEIKAAGTAVGKVMDDSDQATVTAALAAVDAARARIDAANIPDADRERLRTALARHEGMLEGKMTSRTAAMKAEAKAVHAGIARYDDTDDVPTRRHAAFSDNEEDPLDKDATLDMEIGKADTVSLERDKDAMVAALKGWTGSRYTLESGGATYEAVVYDNRYSKPNDRFRVAWSAELQSDGWLNEAGTRTGDDKKINSVTTAGVTRIGGFGEVLTGIRGEHSGVPGTYSCAPAENYACAVRF